MQRRKFLMRSGVLLAPYTVSRAQALSADTGVEPAVIRLGQLSSTSPVNRIGMAVLTRLYASVGQPVEFVELPLRRSLQMVLDGSLDGEVFRVAALAEREPTLLRIPTPLLAVESRAYVRNDAGTKRPVQMDWQGMAGYRVAYERGSLQIENNLQGIAQLVQSSDMDEAMRFVSAGSADVAIFNEPKDARPQARAAQLNLVRLDLPVDATLFYHYLGSRHGLLAQKLDKALRKMQASGQLDAIRRKVLKDLQLD